ncbi:MAG: hypothetical protein QW379_00845 [Thermoplasmata archaeon]
MLGCSRDPSGTTGLRDRVKSERNRGLLRRPPLALREPYVLSPLSRYSTGLLALG